jgi:hypothetical protein
MVNATPRPLYPRERPGAHCTGGWVGIRAGLDGCGKSRSHLHSILGPPSLHRTDSHFLLGYTCQMFFWSSRLLSQDSCTWLFDVSSDADCSHASQFVCFSGINESRERNRSRLYDYRGADKSLAQHTYRCILFDGENISFDPSLVLYMYMYIYIYI